jgi:streptogramin lyase
MKHRLATLRLFVAATLLAAPAVVRAHQTLYISTSSGTVDTLNPSGVVSTFARVASGPQAYIFGIAFSPSGDLFAVNYKKGVISRIKPDGAVSTFATLPDGSTPAGITFDAAGNLYTANDGNDTISKVSPTGEIATYAVLPAGSGPDDVAFDASGNLFVADQHSNDVSKITPDGTVSIFAKFSKDAGTNGLAFNANGNLFVSNYGTGEIAKITPDGKKSQFADLGTKPEPFGISFGPNGSLYVTELTGIAVITPKGEVSTLAQLGHIPAFVKFGPPAAEPSLKASVVATVPQTTVGSGTPGEFTVTLSAPQPADVSIGYEIEGSATNGADYKSLSDGGTVFGSPVGREIIKAGETSANIEVKPKGDLDGTAKKTVKLVLAPGLHYSVDTMPAATVHILSEK